MSIAITELIKEQAYECFIMFCAGMAFMLFYQVCSFLLSFIQIAKWIKAGLEIVFWLAAAVMTSQFLYYCSYGSLSVHCICAFAAGVLLWKTCFYGIILPTQHEGNRTRGLRKRHGKKKKKQSI